MRVVSLWNQTSIPASSSTHNIFTQLPDPNIPTSSSTHINFTQLPDPNLPSQIMSASAPRDNSKPWFPLAGQANDGWSNEEEATATCFCGAVQLSFVSSAPIS
jgi:hypothetical protein